MKKDIYAVLGERVRLERKRAGLTLEQLASAAGISASFLAYIETRGSKPSLATVEKLAAALELPIAELFRGMPAAREQKPYAATRKFRLLVRDKSEAEQEAILDVVRAVARKLKPSR